MKKIFNKIKEYFTKYNESEINFTKSLKKICKKYKYLLVPFLILLIIYSIAYFPIFRANFNYIDDMGRVAFGYQNWDNFSRYISNFLSKFIHTSSYLTDISPLTQIIAIVFLALSGIIILKLFKNKNKKINITSVLAVSIIGLCPYFLECISYKYDSPYMSLSILSSVFPFLLFNKNKKYNLLFVSCIFVGTLIMCMTYQAASGIIPMIALFLSYRYWNEKDNKNAIKILIFSAIGYFVGLLVFKLFIMKPVESYVSNAMFSLKDLIPGIINNLKTYYTYVLTDFRRLWLILFIIIIMFFVLKQVKDSKQKKIYAFGLTIVFIVIIFCLAFGMYPVLEKPIFSPRGMYGFGILLVLFMVNTVNDNEKYIQKLFVIGLCYCFITFSFTYGNALSEQKRYIDFRVQNVINGLNDLEIMNTNDIKKIKLVGIVGSSPVINHFPDHYKNLINRLVQQSFGDNWMWNQYYFQHYFMIKNVYIDYNIDVPKEKFKLYKDTMYYKIESNGSDFIIITLK